LLIDIENCMYNKNMNMRNVILLSNKQKEGNETMKNRIIGKSKNRKNIWAGRNIITGRI
jgi:hypothetical protein